MDQLERSICPRDDAGHLRRQKVKKKKNRLNRFELKRCAILKRELRRNPTRPNQPRRDPRVRGVRDHRPVHRFQGPREKTGLWRAVFDSRAEVA